jgi:AraC-like DNA-binding protein
VSIRESGGAGVTTNELTKLAAAVGRRAAADGAYDTPVEALRLYHTSAPTELAAVVYEPSLCVVVQGAKEVVLEGHAHRYDPAHWLLVSVDTPAVCRVVEASSARPCLTARVALDAGVVGELLADCPAAPVGPPVRGLAVTPADPPLLDAVGRLVALLDTPNDVGVLAPLVLREITYRVLTGPQGARLRQIASAGAPAHRIARAIRWLKDHFTEPLSVEALARRVGMSPSAFHLHFKAVTGQSPLQYQKQLRLQEARRLMFAERLEAADAAYRVGYESPSQFSREFKRLFGAPPVAEATRLRGRAPVGVE